MAITKIDIIKALEEMKLKELNELVKEIEKHFDVVASTGVATVTEKVVESIPSEVSVLLTSVGVQKVQVIKAIKELTGLGLMDAKKLIDGILPVIIKENVKIEDADVIKARLIEAGASVELK